MHPSIFVTNVNLILQMHEIQNVKFNGSALIPVGLQLKNSANCPPMANSPLQYGNFDVKVKDKTVHSVFLSAQLDRFHLKNVSIAVYCTLKVRREDQNTLKQIHRFCWVLLVAKLVTLWVSKLIWLTIPVRNLIGIAGEVGLFLCTLSNVYRTHKNVMDQKFSSNYQFSRKQQTGLIKMTPSGSSGRTFCCPFRGFRR